MDTATASTEIVDTPLQAAIEQTAAEKAVACRKFLLHLIAAHPGKAAQLLLNGSNEPKHDEKADDKISLLPIYRIQEKLSEPAVRDNNGDPLIRTILEVVGDKYGFTYAELVSNRRTGDIARARHIACYLAKHLTRYSFPKIGREMGDRDHTTILHGVRTITKRLAKEEGLLIEVKSLMATLSLKEAA